jgi:transcriptional regulator with XRE-family HTH domain
MRRCKWLRERWRSMGFTLARLSRLSGVSRRSLERIAVSASNPSLRTLQKLAGPLKLTARMVLLLATQLDVDPSVLEGALPDHLSETLAEQLQHLQAAVEVLAAEVERIRRKVE